MKKTPIPAVVQEKAFALMADDFEKHGLRLEDNFRVSSEGMAMTHAAARLINRAPLPMKVKGNDSLEGMGLNRDGGFWHPLSEIKSEEESGIEGGLMNLWASASIFISAAMGWSDLDATASLKVVEKQVGSVAPTVSIPELMRAARYDDAALLKLAGLVHQGLSQQFEKALG